jgi:hypothetical protein
MRSPARAAGMLASTAGQTISYHFRMNQIGVVLCNQCYRALMQADERAWALASGKSRPNEELASRALLPVLREAAPFASQRCIPAPHLASPLKVPEIQFPPVSCRRQSGPASQGAAPVRGSSELAATIRANKAELLLHLRAEQEEGEIVRIARADAEREDATATKALSLLNRLRCFALPVDGRPVVNQLAEALAPFAYVADPAAILGLLRDFENELIALRGAPNLELTKAVTIVERSFPGARLTEVRRKLP